MAGNEIFAEIRKSQKLYEQAFFHYTQGRNIHGAGSDEAIKRLNDVVDL